MNKIKYLVCVLLLCSACSTSTTLSDVEDNQTEMKQKVCTIVSEENTLNYRIKYTDENNVNTLSFEVSFDMGVTITDEMLASSESALLSELEDVVGVSATVSVASDNEQVLKLVASIDIQTYDFSLDPTGVFNGENLKEQTLGEIVATLTSAGAVCS